MRVYEYVVLEWPKVEHATATQVQGGKPEILGNPPIKIRIAEDADAVTRFAIFNLPKGTDIDRVEVLVRPFG